MFITFVKIRKRMECRKLNRSLPCAPYGSIYRTQDLLRMLLPVRAISNIVDIDGDTAVMIAAHHGFAECVRELLKYSADPNVRNKDDKAALMIAQAKGHADCVARTLEQSSEIVYKHA